MVLTNEWWLWALASAFILTIVGIGFYLEYYRNRVMRFKEACLISVSWVFAALVFNIFLWYYLKIKFNYTIANQKAIEFLTGYLVEKSLSLDNIFVFALIFRYFGIPKGSQQLVLTYGIFTAVVLRIIMIVSGLLVIEKIHWILQIFGIFLIISGGKILLQQQPESPTTTTIIVNWCHKYLRTTKHLDHKRLFTKIHSQLRATPLFLAMISIEISDILFATDSIPAIFAILDDPFIIITSNLFAILGLRSLYFFLVTGLRKFKFLTPGIAILLLFIGGKMLLNIEVPITTSLGIISSILIGSILLSLNQISKR